MKKTFFLLLSIFLIAFTFGCETGNNESQGTDYRATIICILVGFGLLTTATFILSLFAMATVNNPTFPSKTKNRINKTYGFFRWFTFWPILGIWFLVKKIKR